MIFIYHCKNISNDYIVLTYICLFTEIQCPPVPVWLPIIPSSLYRRFATLLNYTCPVNTTFTTGELWRLANCTITGEWLPHILPCIGRFIMIFKCFFVMSLLFVWYSCILGLDCNGHVFFSFFMQNYKFSNLSVFSLGKFAILSLKCIYTNTIIQMSLLFYVHACHPKTEELPYVVLIRQKESLPQ